MLLRTTMTVTALALITALVLAFDDWQGVLAFRPQYAAFAVGVAAVVGAAWIGRSRRAALVVGGVALAVLAAPYVAVEPSSRILRGVLIDAEPGTPGADVEAMIARAYEGSGYPAPLVTSDGSRLHVSLSNQRAGDSTGAIFHLHDGVVSRRDFVAD